MHGALSSHRSLPAPVGVRDLYARPLALPVLQATVNLGLYAFAATVVAARPWQPLSFSLWPLMGLLLTGFLAAAHDCAHSTLLNTRMANRVAGAAWCTPLLVDFTVFKEAHLTHHKLTRVPGDPEPLEPISSLGEYVRRVLFHNPLRPALGALRVAFGVFPAFIGSSAKRRSARIDAIVVVAWLVTAAVATVLQPRFLVAVYWGPLALFMPMVALTSLPEHHGCGAGPDVLPSTRSVTSNAIVRTILWNGTLHVEHHLFPRVPSCNLPELARRLDGAPVLRTDSYIRFHADLMLQLWTSYSSLKDS